MALGRPQPHKACALTIHTNARAQVVTEKLDGGNCCIARSPEGAGGQPGAVVVYARTHKHPATHPSFGPIKALAAAGGLLDQRLPPGVMLFGELPCLVTSSLL